MIEHRVLWRLIILELFLFQFGICDEFKVGFNKGFAQCKDFENKYFVGDSMDLVKESEDEEEKMYLGGHIDILDDVKEGTMIDIEINKETEVGSEPMWSCTMDLCKSVEDKDAPWAAALQSMNITGCPIKTGIYNCDKFMLDMDFLKDKLNHEWEGSYEGMMTLKNDKRDVIACHMIGMAIVPIDDRK